jgi:hypothetical protein
MMNLHKKSGRGAYKMAICDAANIAAFQWCDSKVVNCVSSYLDFRVASTQRRVGSDRRMYSCPSALVHYQNHMGGVDKGDQIRGHFGGFAAQSHFKKWYKKTVMALLDFMLLNAWKMWNMSAERIEKRERLQRFEFLQIVARELLTYKTPLLVSPQKFPTGRQQAEQIELVEAHKHDKHEFVEPTERRKRCVVCALETTHYEKQLKKCRDSASQLFHQKVRGSYQGTRRNVLRCKQCNIHAHNFIMEKDVKFIHGLFDKMTCMEIVHSSIGKEIWNVETKSKNRYSVNTKHPLVRELKMTVDAHLGIDDKT